ncbi:PE family protein PE3 [Mycobacterium simulans]|uniref:PE family protein PE3 n=1 Tax=Mycobacterium simulans TaxID=627089 RepID=A0A7Z7IHV3_9MYCO|nr:PE-PPE domain-containing protein [Mycobacterium simulans]SOJ52702.1 PE family protein PE3 [Mycobacterium simulans]
MTFAFAQPPLLAAAAADLTGIGSAVSEATVAAAAPTTGLLAAAADEISMGIAEVFGAYGQEFQAIGAQLAAFHNQFVQSLTAAADAYINAEAINAAGLVQGALGGLHTPTSPPALPPVFAQDTALVMGATGLPIPTADYINAVNNLFIQHIQPGAIPKALVTPEQLYPNTGVKSLTFQASVEQGLKILDSAIWEQITAGNHVTVFGYSQSAVIASLEMQHLISLGPNAPDPSQLSFILLGNEMNPNGGIFARFPGLNIASIGLPFYGATPDNPYPTTTYTIEYDGYADFPRYPLNLVSVFNALIGTYTLHPTYPLLTPEQIASATPLPTQGTTSNTYYMIRTEDLPLLAPVRALPVIGEPLAALVQPNLKVIVNLGYGDPYHGYSTSPANVPTPFGLFPDVPPEVVVDALAAGTQQGIQDFTAALPKALGSAPNIAPLELSPDLLGVSPALPPALPALPTPLEVANTFAAIVSTDYAVLLPAADLTLALLTTVPAYNATLFLSQLLQGNLVNAIGYPLAATVTLVTLSGFIEFVVVTQALVTNIGQLQALT